MEEEKDKTLFERIVDQAKNYLLKSNLGHESKGQNLIRMILTAKDISKEEMRYLKSRLIEVVANLNKTGGCDSTSAAERIEKLYPLIDEKIEMTPETRTFDFQCENVICEKPCAGTLTVAEKGHKCMRGLLSTSRAVITIIESSRNE